MVHGSITDSRRIDSGPEPAGQILRVEVYAVTRWSGNASGLTARLCERSSASLLYQSWRVHPSKSIPAIRATS